MEPVVFDPRQHSQRVQPSPGRSPARLRHPFEIVIAGAVDVNGPEILDDDLRLWQGGQPLDRDTREFMEPRFGHDFSQVRIHTNARAAESAQSVQARAYAVGGDVVFGPGQYAPGSSDGKRLLAHELTHTVQQGAAAPLGAQALPAGAVSRQMVQRDMPAFNSGASLPSPSYVNGTPGSTLTGGPTASAGDSNFVSGTTGGPKKEGSNPLAAAKPAVEKINAGMKQFDGVAESVRKLKDGKADIKDDSNRVADTVIGFSKGMNSLASGLDGLINKGANSDPLKQHANANDYADRVVKAANVAAQASEASGALKNFQDHPSLETANAWADSVTGLFTQAGGLLDNIPDGWMPGFIKDYYKGLFTAPANYVNAFKTLMNLHYGAIDLEAGLEHNVIGQVKHTQFAEEPGRSKDKWGKSNIVWKGALVPVFISAHFQPRSAGGLTLQEFMHAHQKSEGVDLYDVSLAAGKALLLGAILRDAPEEVINVETGETLKQRWAAYVGG